MWGIGVDLHLKDHTVVLQNKSICRSQSHFTRVNLDVAFLGVLDFVPAQVVTEAPVVLLNTGLSL